MQMLQLRTDAMASWGGEVPLNSDEPKCGDPGDPAKSKMNSRLM